MQPRILYLGDTALDRQAAYLAGVMTYYGLEFNYLDSACRFSDHWLERDFELVILSDYPAAHFTGGQILALAEKVRRGMGLLMIGGWESFTGLGGDYHTTPLAGVLPVRMQSRDDRINASGPCLIIKEQDHEILSRLPFERNTPAVGGLNAFEPTPDATVLLSAQSFHASANGGKVTFRETRKYPLLVVGRFGLGKTAAFASDVAPHWVGPFVDWGDRRIRACADRSEEIEVGGWYAEFFRNLIHWLLNKEK